MIPNNDGHNSHNMNNLIYLWKTVPSMVTELQSFIRNNNCFVYPMFTRMYIKNGLRYESLTRMSKMDYRNYTIACMQVCTVLNVSWHRIKSDLIEILLLFYSILFSYPWPYDSRISFK